MSVHVKVKLKGRDAARYLGQMAVPGTNSPAPKVSLEPGKKKRLVVIRRGRSG